jgi:hypothetical protein
MMAVDPSCYLGWQATSSPSLSRRVWQPRLPHHGQPRVAITIERDVERSGWNGGNARGGHRPFLDLAGLDSAGRPVAEVLEPRHPFGINGHVVRLVSTRRSYSVMMTGPRRL